MYRILLALLAVIGMAGTAFAADPKPPTTEAFLTDVAVGNQFEIDSSRMAHGKSKSEPVLNLANKIIMDHTEAAVNFKKAVTEAKLKLPPEGLDAKHKAELDALGKLDGAAFDQAYVAAQKKAHTDTIAMFQAYAKGGDNAQMKKFAQEMLPILHGHLEQASRLP